MSLKRNLGSNSFFRAQVAHQVDVLVPREMINKDGCCSVVPEGQGSLQLSKESDLSGLHVIH